jgi:hypothetical protein
MPTQAGKYSGGMGRDRLRPDPKVDSAGNPREPKRQIEAEAGSRNSGSAASLPKDAYFGGGAMSRSVGTKPPLKRIDPL